MTAEFGSHWTIYKKPSEYPSQFVARRWLITLPPTPTEDVFVAEDLSSVRDLLPPGLYCIPASPLDDPSIVEIWI